VANEQPRVSHASGAGITGVPASERAEGAGGAKPPGEEKLRAISAAVPVPGLGALTYSVPDEMALPAVGARVLVPLGKRTVTGIVLSEARGAMGEAGEIEAGGGRHEARKETEEALPASNPEPRASRLAPRTSHPEPRASRLAPRTSDIRALVDVLDAQPFLPADVVALAAWVADYYACGVGEAIATAMPPRAWIESERHAAITEGGEARMLSERGARRDVLELLSGGRIVSVGVLVKRASAASEPRERSAPAKRRARERVGESEGRSPSDKKSRGVQAVLADLVADGLITLTTPLKGTADASRTVRIAVLTAQGSDQVDVKLGARQQQALDLLRGAPDGIPLSELADQGISADSVARLAKLGLAVIERRRVERDPFDTAGDGIARMPVIDLTGEQQATLGTLLERASTRAYHAALLHGVTGSGKTEIYLRLARAVRDAGRGVLLMVPEIALTPAASAIFRAAFGERVAIQHSGLSDGERYDQWQRIRRGDVDIVVGTRSAIFTPLANIGLIVVDEEHDGSYKQEESPRYHGRDVAVVRARSAGALIVLGSATPSLESYHNAKAGRYELLTLHRRVLDRPMANVTIVDMRPEFAAEGPDVVLSSRLRDAMTARLERGEQAIVLLNRRGFATVVFCRQCGETMECPNCSVTLTVHKAAGRARCHYCNHSAPLPKICGKCAGPYLEQLGFGTERVEAEVRSLFPHARVGRVDRDTIRRRGAIGALLAKFAAKELDVLVGTQMIAKGHDFPSVTLVGVISADVGLGLADFRAAERTFQLLTQVAGRAGRGVLAGEAVVQTLYPDHYSIKHACRQDYRAFYEDELTFRRAMRYPPSVALINVVVKARTRQGAMEDAGVIAQGLRLPGLDAWKVLGPAPAPLGRLKGEHRAQLFIKGTQRNAMRKALLTVLEGRPELKRRTIVDVDPMSVL
jgi:primosomal protein N' (replication factor Y) (superfamily II helicase)